MSGRKRIMLGIHWACICVMATVFGYAGIIKLLDPQSFALAVYRYHLIPSQIVNFFSLWLAGLELVVAIALLCGRRARMAALHLQILLLTAFTIGIAVNLLRGSPMACGCLSTSPMALPLGWVGILKNLVLIAFGFCAIRTIPRNVYKGK